jgi:hypothetical protein
MGLLLTATAATSRHINIDTVHLIRLLLGLLLAIA